MSIRGSPSPMDTAVTSVSDFPFKKSAAYLFFIMWAGSLPFAPHTSPSSSLPCVDHINELLVLWLPVGSGNAGWIVRSGYFNPWLPHYSWPCPSACLAAPPHSLLLSCSPSGNYQPRDTVPPVCSPTCCQHLCKYPIKQLLKYPNWNVPSASCWDHN